MGGDGSRVQGFFGDDGNDLTLIVHWLIVQSLNIFKTTECYALNERIVCVNYIS